MPCDNETVARAVEAALRHADHDFTGCASSPPHRATHDIITSDD